MFRDDCAPTGALNSCEGRPPISTHSCSLVLPNPESSPPDNPPQPVILIVDDDPLLRNLLNVLFQRNGFVVRLASSGQEAVNLYQQENGRIHVVLLDVCMPELDGPQTLQELQRIQPGVVACFMSGNTGQYVVQDLIQRGARHFFPKPFRMDEMVQTVGQLACGPARRSA
jgi:DNA-binding NtrC family response regulator